MTTYCSECGKEVRHTGIQLSKWAYKIYREGKYLYQCSWGCTVKEKKKKKKSRKYTGGRVAI